jgi:hypothetical protein
VERFHISGIHVDCLLALPIHQDNYTIMADEIARLRAQIAEAQRGLQEERRLRENAERVAATAIKQSLAPFLRSCHAFSEKIRPVTDPSSFATRGSTTNPTSRLFPQNILNWEDFDKRQQRTWDLLDSIPELWQQPLYPSELECKYVERRIDPIGSEDELRILQRRAVEDMVQDMYSVLVDSHGLAPDILGAGKVSFETQEGFREAEVSTLSDTRTRQAIDRDGSQQRRNTRADQFCVLWRKDGSARPLVAIEYKAPHKLTIQEICTGLQSDIKPEQDVIDQDDTGFVSLCRRLLAAVITQLFSYMIDKCVRYGYVCTGEAYIFVYIPDDPTTVYYSVNIPKTDYEVDAENRLQRTAVSQVFAFIQQALSEDPPGPAWVDDAKTRLKRWKVEFVDVLAMIPQTERKSKEASEYRPREWRKGMRRSPIRLRSTCGGLSINATSDPNNDSDSDDAEQSTSPTLGIQTRSRTMRGTGAAERHTRNRGQQRDRSREGQNRTRIQDRAYCTHSCLLGLGQGLAIDRSCPNALEHGSEHMPKDEFLRHVRQQLAVDRGSNADCCPLFVHGARGALLKLRLSVRGYTLVAKATGHSHKGYLEHEAAVYDRLQGLQGRYVPVCCGILDLDLPYHYDGVELRHALLLSWAGISLAHLMVRDENFASIKPSCDAQAAEAYKAIHALQVRHGDKAPRNMVYDTSTRRLMIIDFERSEINRRHALSELSPNYKRKRLSRNTLGFSKESELSGSERVD